MKTTHYVLRTWDEDNLDRVMAFYRDNATEASPPPSVSALGKAMEDGRLLVVEPEDGGEPVAASAIFDFSPGNYRTYVGELSGTCVTRPLNGCRPHGMQRLLIAVRLAVHATYRSEPVNGETNTLISIVKDDNATSRGHVEGAGLVPVTQLPEWMEYEHRSWTGGDGNGWTYYAVNEATVQQAARELIALDFLAGGVSLRRDDRANGGEEVIRIRCGLQDTPTMDAVLREVAAGRQEVQLSDPPSRLLR